MGLLDTEGKRIQSLNIHTVNWMARNSYIAQPQHVFSKFYADVRNLL